MPVGATFCAKPALGAHIGKLRGVGGGGRFIFGCAGNDGEIGTALLGCAPEEAEDTQSSWLSRAA